MQVRFQTLGRSDYVTVWENMQLFTANRDYETVDEIWTVEHSPVYTLGLNGQPQHIIGDTEIPVIKTDRGGQVTYHGPGQLVVYLLADIKRLKLGPRALVTIIEKAMIAALAQYGVAAHARKEAPGVYVAEKKIGSVGLRVKKGCCYHGLSLNNDMDLTPFLDINPCGHRGLTVTQLADQGVNIKTEELAIPVLHYIYTAIYQ